MLDEQGNSPLVSLQYKTHTVRNLVDEQGHPWWVATDVCAVLELSDVSKTCKRLDADEKATKTFPTPGGPQDVLIINEPGLYKLILRSTKTEAKPFQRWVTHEVLPQIRQTGAYRGPGTTDIAAVTDPGLQALALVNQQVAGLIAYAQETRTIAQRAEAKAEAAANTAAVALDAQQWLTIRQYVYKYGLDRQLPTDEASRYGRYLVRYCHTKGIPVYDKPSPVFGHENEYPENIIRTTLPRWFARRAAQGDF